MLRALIISFIMAVSFSAYGDIVLKSVHPDEAADTTYNERLSSERSLAYLARIQSALESFKKLTAEAAGKISQKRLRDIGNTGWEEQNLGFVNHVEAIKGTILKQEYLVKKLTYELAQKKAKAGEMNQENLLEAQREFEKAQKQFLEFWNTFGIAD
ncbi:MAG: hypothetical protein JXA41_10225 [Deltaproteobacteria bacterium]|nr:hypothetical protein [Deltaproteobacteria bacterium]